MPPNDPNQYNMSDYQLKEVHCRLVLAEGQTLYSDKAITNSEDAVAVMSSLLKTLDREMCCVVNVDNHLRPINFHVVSIGSLNQSLVPVQNTFKTAILSNARGIFLMHNHPSGVITPSSEDHALTRRMVEAGKLLDIPVFDHIIVGAGNEESYSFREHEPGYFGDRIDAAVISSLMQSPVRERGSFTYETPSHASAMHM